MSPCLMPPPTRRTRPLTHSLTHPPPRTTSQHHTPSNASPYKPSPLLSSPRCATPPTSLIPPTYLTYLAPPTFDGPTAALYHIPRPHIAPREPVQAAPAMFEPPTSYHTTPPHTPAFHHSRPTTTTSTSPYTYAHTPAPQYAPFLSQTSLSPSFVVNPQPPSSFPTQPFYPHVAVPLSLFPAPQAHPVVKPLSPLFCAHVPPFPSHGHPSPLPNAYVSAPSEFPTAPPHPTSSLPPPHSPIPDEPMSVDYHCVHPASPSPSPPSPLIPTIPILVEQILRLEPGQHLFAYEIPPETLITAELAMFSIRATRKLEQEILERIESLEKRFMA